VTAARGQPRTDTSPRDSVDVLDRTIRLYDTGRIAEAEFTALKALDNPEKLSRYTQFRLNQILAFCAIANGDNEGGVRRFVAALRLNRGLTPDPITWSPKVRDAFEKAREEFNRQLASERRQRWAEEADICRKASLHSLYLPGSGQFKKGQRKRGLTVGVLFYGAVAAFFYSQAILPNARDRYLDAESPSDIRHRWKDYRDVYHLSTVSGLVAASVYTYAFFDALWSRPHTQERQDSRP